MPEREDGPGITRAASEVTPPRGTAPSVAQPDDPTAHRRRWAYSLIRRASTPVPSYGSSAWANLADGDPEKVAGCVVAAESWARAGDDLEGDLRRELDARRRADKQVDGAAYRAAVVEHRQRWRHLGLVGSVFSTEEQRVAAARKPRPGDRPGRSDGGAA